MKIARKEGSGPGGTQAGMPVLQRFICLFFILSLGALWAQTGTGSVQGTVADQSGAVIPNSKLAVVQVETGNTFNTVSNSTGFFIFPSLKPGKYRLTAESPGMEKWQGDLQLQTGQEAVIKPVLKVGGTATEVTVAGDVTPLVTTTSPTLAAVVDRARIEQLPINGRLIQNQFVQMTPGMDGSTYGNTNASAYGLRDTTTQFVQDGASIKDANTGALSQRPPGMDTIQEYRVEVSVPSAKYDAPATLVISTRSGTNQYHGSLFYTGLNNGFGRARQRQDLTNEAPHYVRNEYGASQGGPVKLPHLYNGRDRTFFFAAWEGYKLRNGSTMSTGVPTAAMRQGDFSQLTNGQSQPITLYDPWTTAGAAQNYTRVPFTGNRIPITRLSPFAAYYYSVLPEPNQPNNPAVSANWFGPDPSTQDDWTFTTRVDHRLSDKDQIFGRYSVGDQLASSRRTASNTTPITSDNYWNAQATTQRIQTGAFTWNHTFGPSFFMETIVTGERMNWRFDLVGGVVSNIVSDKLGVPNLFRYGGAPTISNLGLSLSGEGTIPRSEDTKPITVQQNFTKVRGKHEVEFGWRFQRMFLDVLPDQPAESAISFASQATGLYDPATGTAYNSMTRTGDNLANFFLGVAASYSQSMGAPKYNLRGNEISGYVQDTWKATRNLTLNLGLRYDFMQPLLDARTNAVFDFKNHAIVRKSTIAQLIEMGATTQSIVNQDLAIGVKFENPQQAVLPDNLVNVGQRNFSPRVGMAYSVKLGPRTVVVRGGFGEYRFNLGTRLFNVQRGNPPLQGAIAYNINSSAKSPDGLANYGLRSAPTVIAGTSSGANAIDPSAANTLSRGVNINTFAPDLPTSLAREWNVTLETEVLRNTLLRVAYVGTQGRNLDETVYKNGQPNNLTYYTTTGKPLPTGAYAPVALRNYDQTTYGDIALYSHVGYSNFSGFQVEAQRRLQGGLVFQWYYVMSNAMWTGSGQQIQANSSLLPDPVTFLPGSVSSNFDAYNRFYNYSRDYYIPHHRVNWNMLYELPVGHGKKWLANSGGLVNRLAGGWQMAASSTMNSRYVTLPTGNWGPTAKVAIFGKKYPVMDCRSGGCISGYLWYNGYIPANQINTHNAAGQCTGVCGVPSNYVPSSQPINPTPASGCASGDAYCGTNNVLIPMQSGTPQRVSYDNGLNAFQNQYIPGPWALMVNSSLFKVIPINERLKLRLNMDAFNVLNMPGTPLPAAATGIISLRNSSNAARQLQWTLRLSW